MAEREEISRELAKGRTLTSIAVLFGRSVSTVSREVKRNTTESGFREVRADRMALARTRRSGLRSWQATPDCPRRSRQR